jgi:hypothetical protein
LVGKAVLLLNYESFIRRQGHPEGLVHEGLDQDEACTSLKLTIHVYKGKYPVYFGPDKGQHIAHDTKYVYRHTNAEAEHLEGPTINLSIQFIKGVALAENKVLQRYIIRLQVRWDFADKMARNLSEVQVLFPKVLYDQKGLTKIINIPISIYL